MKQLNADLCHPESPLHDDGDERSDKYETEIERYDPYEVPHPPKFRMSNSSFSSRLMETALQNSNISNKNMLPSLNEDVVNRAFVTPNHSASTVQRKGSGNNPYYSNSNDQLVKKFHKLEEDEQTPPNQVGRTLMIEKSESDLSSITETYCSKSPRSSRIHQQILCDILNGKIPDFLDKDKVERLLNGDDLSEIRDEISLKSSFYSKRSTEIESPCEKDRSVQRGRTSRRITPKFARSPLSGSRFFREKKSKKEPNINIRSSPASHSNSKKDRNHVPRRRKSVEDDESSYSRYNNLSQSCHEMDDKSLKSVQSWTSVAIKAASSVLEAGGSQKAAEAATTAILTVGSKMKNMHESGLEAAAEASTAVLAVSNEQTAAAAAALTVLKACEMRSAVESDEHDNQSTNSKRQNDFFGRYKRSGFDDKDSLDSTYQENKENMPNLSIQSQNNRYKSKPPLPLRLRTSHRSINSRESQNMSNHCDRSIHTYPPSRSKYAATPHYTASSARKRANSAQSLSSFLNYSNKETPRSNKVDSDMFSIKSSDILNHVSELTKYVSTLMSPPSKKQSTSSMNSKQDDHSYGGDSGTIVAKKDNVLWSPASKSQYSYGGDSGTIKNYPKDNSDAETVQSEFEFGSHLMSMVETSNEIELSILASRTKEILNEVKRLDKSPTEDKQKTVLSKARKHLANLVTQNKRERRIPKFTF